MDVLEPPKVQTKQEPSSELKSAGEDGKDARKQVTEAVGPYMLARCGQTQRCFWERTYMI